MTNGPKLINILDLTHQETQGEMERAYGSMTATDAMPLGVVTGVFGRETVVTQGRRSVGNNVMVKWTATGGDVYKAVCALAGVEAIDGCASWEEDAKVYLGNYFSYALAVIINRTGKVPSLAELLGEKVSPSGEQSPDARAMNVDSRSSEHLPTRLLSAEDTKS